MAGIKRGKPNLNHEAKSKTGSRNKQVADPQILIEHDTVSYLIKLYIFITEL